MACVLAGMLGAALAPISAQAQTATDDASLGANEAFAEALALYRDRLYGASQEAFADYRTAFPDDPHAAEALFYEARALLALDQSAAAARRLERLERTYPAHPLAQRARLRLGRYFFEQGDAEDARQTLRRIVATSPEGNAEARFLLGLLARRETQPDEALRQFRAVAREHPDAPQAPRALYQMASVHLDMGRTREAATTLERLARRYPEAEQAQTLGLALAEVYADLGRYGAVLDELERREGQLRSPADRARATLLRAEALRQRDDLPGAARAYRRYLDRSGDQPDVRAARFGLALTYYRQEDYARAADLFARAAVPEASEDDALAERAAYLHAASLAAAGRPGDAAERFAGFLDLFPRSTRRAEARYRQARALLDAEQPGAAARVLDGFAETFPDADRRDDARFLRGRALAETGGAGTGDPSEALDALGEALASNLPPEQRAQASFERARLLLRAGRTDEAADAFATYRQRFPRGAKADAARFWEAESHYRAGALPRAAAGYQSYLSRAPRGAYAAAAQYGLGWASFQQENYEAAARAFERFLDAPGTRRGSAYYNDALLRLGDSHYARRRFEEAARSYARAGSAARDYALYQTGQARARLDAPDEALSAWRTLLDEFPQSNLREEARFQIGQTLFQEGRNDEAVRAWRALLDDGATGTLAARAQYGIGDALYNAGRTEAAARAYRTVLERYPDSPYTAAAAGSIQDALLAAGDADGAEALADSLEAADPEAAAQLRFRQAEAQYQRGQTDEARRALQRFVRTSSDENLLPQAYYYLGTLYAENDQPQEAEGYLRQVVRDYPDSDRRADAAGRLGTLYLATDRPARALSVFEQMETFGAEGDAGSDRLLARALYGQGRALRAQGRADAAEARLQRAAERAPAGSAVAEDVRVALARLYEDTGRTGEALALYRRVADESRGRAGAEALYRRGALLLAEGRPEDAVEELRRLPELFAGYPDWIARSLLEQARALRRLDRPGQADRLYQRLQDEFAGTDYARTARQEQAEGS